MASLLPVPYYELRDDDGNPLAGGKVYTYAAGTTTPQATYTSEGAGTPNANPVVLDAAGRAVIFWSGSYKIKITDANDVLIREVDNVTTSSGGGGGTSSFTDDTFEIVDNSDATKKMMFSVGGITTGTTRTITMPDDNITLVGTAATQTLTNKTLTDSTTYFADESDATKKLTFQLSGITTATTRTVTWPDKNGTVAMTSDITATGTVTSVATSGGITGGTITTSGTVSLDTNNTLGVGSTAWFQNGSGGTINSAATTAGSNLTTCKGTATGFTASGGANPSGTWRNTSGFNVPTSDYGQFTRTA